MSDNAKREHAEAWRAWLANPSAATANAVADSCKRHRALVLAQEARAH